MNALNPTQLAEIVADCQTRTKAAAERLLKTLRFVPDDKLRWSPSSTARSALAIAVHCANGTRFFAKVIRGEPLSPIPAPEEIEAAERKAEAAVTDRGEAVLLVEQACAEAVAALGTMTPERYASSPDSPFGPFPMRFWMELPDRQTDNHAAQIDYLQTIWGDLVSHE